MVRFFVNLLMIPGVLLTQFATVPHAHAAGTRGSAHEGQPHFHFHLRFSLGDSTDPARVAVETRACSGSGCATNIVADPSHPEDHDADAVYTEATTASPERQKQFLTELPAVACPLPFAPAFDLYRARVRRPHASPAHFRAPCPLYVRYLALTI